jgi:hypothetical protein
VSLNVNQALAVDGSIYVLQGISHLSLSEGQLARVWREHDHFTSHVITHLAGAATLRRGVPVEERGRR